MVRDLNRYFPRSQHSFHVRPPGWQPLFALLYGGYSLFLAFLGKSREIIISVTISMLSPSYPVILNSQRTFYYFRLALIFLRKTHQFALGEE